MKRIYIPMPDPDTRRALLKHLLSGQPAKLSRADIERLVAATHNYSGSDLAALCREAAIIPIRQAPTEEKGSTYLETYAFLCCCSCCQALPACF